MRRVEVREFRDHATQFLSGDEVLAIQKNGRPVGFHVPAAPPDQDRFAHALLRLEDTVQQVLAESGLSELELSRLFDLKNPVLDRPE